jgi:hypothetical protein
MEFDEMIKEEIVDYDKERYNFRDIVAKILECEDRDLSLLHETIPGSEDAAILTLAHDQCLVFHRMYYQSPLLVKVLELYEEMIKNYIAPMFKDDVIVYQKKPTFRVHLPNNVAVPSDVGGDPERPGLHCDAMFNHPPGEINFWVPFTQTTPDNTMWLETERLKGDYHPAILDNGSVLRFYGNQVFHYNKVNKGGRTRVSFDFRVIPLSQYNTEMEVKRSVQSARRFTVGDGEMDYYATYDKRTGGKYTFESRGSSPSTVVDEADAAADAVEPLGYTA